MFRKYAVPTHGYSRTVCSETAGRGCARGTLFCLATTTRTKRLAREAGGLGVKILFYDCLLLLLLLEYEVLGIITPYLGMVYCSEIDLGRVLVKHLLVLLILCVLYVKICSMRHISTH
jgi:hypothetical protein